MKSPAPFTHPSGKAFTRQQLSPCFLQAVQTAKAELPELIGNRLTHGRHARNHGNYADFTLINLWDTHQTAVLPKDHFTYCLNYCQNRRNGRPQDGELHVWINKIRLYQNRDRILEILDKRLPKAVPPVFTFESTERFYSISHRFWFPADLELFTGYIVPLYHRLILAVHPVLMEVIDGYTGPMEKEALRAVVRERDRIPFQPPGRRLAEELRAYNRSIAPSLRARILRAANHACAGCGADLHLTGHHIDHIVPFSRGGPTIEANLQALCPRCNLTKGNR